MTSITPGFLTTTTYLGKQWVYGFSNLPKILFRPQSRTLAYYTVKDNATDTNNLNKIQTAVLMLDLGEPCSKEEAIPYTYKSFASFYNHCPRFLANHLHNFWLRISGSEKLSFIFSHEKLVNDSYRINENHSKLCSAVEGTLEHIIPEFAPHKCFFAHALQAPSIENVLDDIQSLSPDRLLVLSLYPHFWCYQTTTSFAALNKALKSRGFNPRSEWFKNKLISRPPNQFHVNSSMSCSIIDRWSGHPALVQSWVESMETELVKFPYDVQSGVAFLFVAQDHRMYNSENYRKEVHSTCSRISEYFNHDHPYTLAFYPSWNQWSLQLGRPTIRQGIRRLVREGRRNILVIPVTNPITNIDTLSILPAALDELKLSKLGVHHLRSVPCPDVSNTFVHAFAELCKNHLLHGGSTSPQYSIRCPNCYSSQCYSARRLFVL